MFGTHILSRDNNPHFESFEDMGFEPQIKQILDEARQFSTGSKLLLEVYCFFYFFWAMKATYGNHMQVFFFQKDVETLNTFAVI